MELIPIKRDETPRLGELLAIISRNDVIITNNGFRVEVIIIYNPFRREDDVWALEL